MLKVTLSRSPLGLEFEVGSVEEALGILQDSKAKFIEVLDLANELSSASPDDTSETSATTAAATSETAAAPASKPRGRKPKNQPDPATASAPAPAPVPAAAPAAAPAVPSAPAAPTPPLATAENSNGIPAFLDRKDPAAAVNQVPAAPAAPPPPVLPSAPPVAPAAPPTSVLAPKIKAALDVRKSGAVDGGGSLATWLSDPAFGIIAPGANYDECIAVLPFQDDAKLAPIAAALGIS